MIFIIINYSNEILLSDPKNIPDARNIKIVLLSRFQFIVSLEKCIQRYKKGKARKAL